MGKSRFHTLDDTSKNIFCLFLCKKQEVVGIVKSENCVFDFSLRSPFAIFEENRMRFGIVKSENYVFDFSLRSPFTIFVQRSPGRTRYKPIDDYFLLRLTVLTLSANMPQRKIIHIDMDAFYASVEQRDNPAYRGKPIAVGHSGPRGVVATASYEARPYGVHSALSSAQARRLCPQLIFVTPRHEVYKAVSIQIRQIFLDYTELVEPLSLDEAFLDVSHERSATLVAREIKRRILAETQLTASAGVSINKMLAKIASDYRKPNGLFTIAPAQVEAFVAALPIERFFGIGGVTKQKMHSLGILTGADLRQWDEASLVRQFGKAGHLYYGYARGIDNREVTPNRIRKSISAETTFAEDTDDRSRLAADLSEICDEVWERLQRHHFKGKTVVLKLKFDNFKQITRSKTQPAPIDSITTLHQLAQELLATCHFEGHKIRLIGVGVGNSPEAGPDGVQLRLPFDDLP